MRIEAKYDRSHIDQYLESLEKHSFFDISPSLLPYLIPIFLGYTATHGRVTATAPTMHEAIALCLNGVYQARFIKSND